MILFIILPIHYYNFQVPLGIFTLFKVFGSDFLRNKAFFFKALGKRQRVFS